MHREQQQPVAERVVTCGAHKRPAGCAPSGTSCIQGWAPSRGKDQTSAGYSTRLSAPLKITIASLAGS